MTGPAWDEEWFLREDLEDPGHAVPTTDQVLYSYAKDYYACTVRGGDGEQRLAQVKRWLAEVMADAWDEGFTVGFDGATLTPNPYRQGES